jgi:hypothetical protein
VILDRLASQLPSDGFHGLSLPCNDWQVRSVRWHFHDRAYALFAGTQSPPSRVETTLVLRPPWGPAEAAPGHFTLIPKRIEVGTEHIELAALIAAREQNWSADVTRKLGSRFSERLRLFEAEVRSAYLDSTLITPLGLEERLPRMPAEGTFLSWLERIVESIFKRIHPSFETYAPVYGPLPKEAYRALMRFATQQDLGEPTDEPYVQLIREAYLVPMKLLRPQGRGYVFAKHPDRNELVRAVRSLIDCQPAPPVVYKHLAESVYGLVPDQVSLLLIVLLILGEIDMIKDRKSYRETFETLPVPLQFDRIVPGTALGMDQLRKLTTVCDGLGVRTPPQWTVLAQRRAARELAELGQARSQVLQALILKLREWGQGESLCERIQQALRLWTSLEKGRDELEGLQQFLYEISSPEAFVETMAELAELPAKIDRLVNDLQRMCHVLEHPAIRRAFDGAIDARIQALGPPPQLDRADAAAKWLKAAHEIYADYQREYRRLHDAWWAECAKHDVWSWRPSPLARSRHLGLANELQQLGSNRAAAQQLRCRSLVNLDFQPICNCQFDGTESPIREVFDRFQALRKVVEESISRFFAQDEVRSRLRQWVSDRIEVNPQTLAYLNGLQSSPQISNLDLFDDYLSGLKLVSEVDVTDVAKLLQQQTWDRQSLVQAFDAWIGRRGEGRLRFRASKADSQCELARWCLARALESGVPLPEGLPAESLQDAADAMTPGWIRPAAIPRLDELGIGDAAVNRILQWIAEARVQVGDPYQASPSVFAAAHLARPVAIETPQDLADCVERLYLAHQRLHGISKRHWLKRLDEIARTSPVCEVRPLTDVLKEHIDAQWVVLDCLGLPLLSMLRSQLESLFPDWRLDRQEFARVSRQTTTDQFYRDVVNTGVQQAIEKTNVVDNILHARFLPLADVARIASAELTIAARSICRRLEKKRPLLVLADHGFRIAADGHSYTHGGDSELERIVPVLRLKPKMR